MVVKKAKKKVAAKLAEKKAAAPKKEEKEETSKEKKEDYPKVFGVLTYLFIGIVGIVWYLCDEDMRRSSFAKFHYKQSLVLLVTVIVVGGIAELIDIGFIQNVVSLLFVVLIIMGIVHVANGDEKELPVIGFFAKKLKF